jgi:hypothetical protein
VTATIALLPLAVVIAATALCVWRLLAGLRTHGTVVSAVLAASLAFPLGGGLVSLLHFALLPLGVEHPAISGLLLLGLLAGGWLAAGRWLRPDNPLEAGPPVAELAFPYTWVLGMVAVGTLLAMLSSTLMHIAEAPHGEWDSWAIWTVKAKYLASGEPYWRNAVDPTYRFMHPEYPLLTPSLMAWCWKFGTSWPMVVPQAVAMLSLLSLTGITFATVALLRGPALGFVALLTVCAPNMLVANGAALYSDIPMAAVLAAAAALAALSVSGKAGPVAAVLAGMLAGLCAWTKLEGVIHIAALTSGMGLATLWPWLLRRWKSAEAESSETPAGFTGLIAYVGGLVPVGLFLVWYRMWLPSPALAEIASVSTTENGLLSLILNPARYVEIVTTAVDVVRLMGPLWAHPFAFLALAVLFLGLSKNREGWRAPAALVAAWAVIWAGYFTIYLTTVNQPEPLMRNSLDRLLMHPWPMLVIAVCLAVNRLEDWAIPVAEKVSRRERKKQKNEGKPDMFEKFSKGKSRGRS